MAWLVLLCRWDYMIVTARNKGRGRAVDRGRDSQGGPEEHEHHSQEPDLQDERVEQEHQAEDMGEQDDWHFFCLAWTG